MLENFNRSSLDFSLHWEIVFNLIECFECLGLVGLFSIEVLNISLVCIYILCTLKHIQHLTLNKFYHGTSIFKVVMLYFNYQDSSLSSIKSVAVFTRSFLGTSHCSMLWLTQGKKGEIYMRCCLTMCCIK